MNKRDAKSLAKEYLAYYLKKYKGMIMPSTKHVEILGVYLYERSHVIIACHPRFPCSLYQVSICEKVGPSAVINEYEFRGESCEIITKEEMEAERK